MAGNVCYSSFIPICFFFCPNPSSVAVREGHPLLHLRLGPLRKLEYNNPFIADDATNFLIYSIERAVSTMSVGVTKMGVIGNAIGATVAVAVAVTTTTLRLDTCI